MNALTSLYPLGRLLFNFSNSTMITEKQSAVTVGEDLVNKSTEIVDYSKLAHDLKGPLNSIKGLLNIAMHEVDHLDAQRYLNLIEHYQQLLYYRINELLNKVQVSEKHDTLDFLKESQIFESIRLPLLELISHDKTNTTDIKYRIPFSEKVDRVNSLNEILDTLQKNRSGKKDYNGSGHIDLVILARDINGSLNSIKVLLEIALIETENETARNYFGLLEKTRKKLFLRVEETLKRMHGNNHITISRIDFDKLIDKVRSSLKYMDGSADTIFTIMVKNQSAFFSDAEALSSIIQNLVENAIKYRKQDTSRHDVKLTVTDVPEGVMIKITDNGVGIKKELFSRIFNFGVRDKNTQEEGHGIGLTLVKQLVEQLGGEISMDSVKEQGTSFTLFIPNSK
jgi:signal transduction histidine kinase